MNIAFSYHNGDADLAMESAKAITSMGINMRHKATLCCTKDTFGASDIIHELKKSFPEVDQLFVQDGFDGWPLGPNQMFADVAAAMYASGVPFYFWEPDCVPMKEGWVDDLDAEYHRKVGIMGHLYEGGMASNGKNIYKMIVGSAVYPPNFLEFCPSAQSLSTYNLAYKNAGAIPEPWDVRCRWNFMAIGRDTPLIRTYWKSVNYQWKDGKIVFFAEDPEAQAVQGVTCPDMIISSQAVVIHGCKDGSLHKMAQEGFPIPQSVINEIQSSTVCNNASEVVRNLPEVATKSKSTMKPKNNSSQKAKKKRVISEEERERRRQSMLAILQKKRERMAQEAV
jgi:hypothetical protein